jgi:hypothetical protein
VDPGIGDQESREENQKFVSDPHSMKYGGKKHKTKGKEKTIMGGPESPSPIEGGPEV